MDRNYYADKDADWVRVALRKESVDRNSFYAQYRHLTEHVALRKESVDRNGFSYFYIIKITGRSPQGERG